jgi:signal transduction histidine kinase
MPKLLVKGTPGARIAETMAYVVRSNAVVARVTDTGRRIADVPDLPLRAAVVLGLLAMVEVVLRAGNTGTDTGGDVTSAVLISLGTTVPLAFARTHVVAAATTITGSTFVTFASGHWLTVAGVIAEVVVLYLLGLRRSRRLSLLVILLFAGYAIVAPFDGSLDGRLLAILLLSLAAGALAVGGARRVREQARERDASRQAIADSLLEHAARGERARIARELHDVVAHHISMIAVQVETARLTTPDLPPEGARRLVAIGDTARTALTEMRRLLGVLREDAGAEVTRQPQPGLEQLNELIDEARELARASTRLIVHGRVVPLDPGVELTAYRIVQEALTNARRHAPGAAVDVELAYAERALHVRVRDSGPGPSVEGTSGHGLLGMRERAAIVGGEVRTGQTATGGFLVEAILPTVRLPS